MEKTTILDDIRALREFAARPESTIDLSRASAVLGAVARVFAPSKRSETRKTVAPEVARAELAKLPVPRQLWDDVLEPLLAMAEGAAHPGLEEALQKLRSATSRADSVDACSAALRAVTSVQLLLGPTEGGTYEAAVQIAGEAYQAQRAIMPYLDRLAQATNTGDDRTAIERARWCVEAVTILREVFGLPQSWDQAMPSAVVAIAEDDRSTITALRNLTHIRPGACEAATNRALCERVKVAFGQLQRLVRDARLVADDAIDLNDADIWQGTVNVAIDAVRALMTLSQGYSMPDYASWMRIVDDCLRNRRAVPLLRAELERRGYAKLMRDGRAEVEVLRDFARECPINFAEGHTPQIAAVLEAVESLFSRVESHIPSLPPRPSPFSKELERYRASCPLPSILSWMEMIERRVALLVEHARTAPAIDDETPKPGPAVETGDAVEALRRLIEVIEQGGGSAKLSLGVELGAMSWMVKLAAAIDGARAVLERNEIDIAVNAWDRHSEAICDALGPYYSDDGCGYDYDGMVLAIRALRAHSQALQELLSIHESDWPHDVAMKAATCVTLLSKSCNRWYCANGLMVAAGGSCPSCGPAAVAQQTPDPAQGA